MQHLVGSFKQHVLQYQKAWGERMKSFFPACTRCVDVHVTTVLWLLQLAHIQAATTLQRSTSQTWCATGSAPASAALSSGKCWDVAPLAKSTKVQSPRCCSLVATQLVCRHHDISLSCCNVSTGHRNSRCVDPLGRRVQQIVSGHGLMLTLWTLRRGLSDCTLLFVPLGRLKEQ